MDKSRSNKVFIATSLDGFIAGTKGEIDWLDLIPNTEGTDMGYFDFYKNIDALLMGRKTFETVIGFDVDWPYDKPVFVLSNSMKSIPESHQGKAFLVNGKLRELVADLNDQGYRHLYIDGGKTIQSFLEQDLIDEMIITTIPILLGEGIPLFSSLENRLVFTCVQSHIHLSAIVQSQFVRTRNE